MPDPHDAPSRRAMLTAALVGGSAAAAALAGAPAAQAAGERAATGGPDGKKHFTLTVLGTTDLHGNVFNWDYFKNAEYDDAAAQRHRHRQGRHPGQARARRARRGAAPC